MHKKFMLLAVAAATSLASCKKETTSSTSATTPTPTPTATSTTPMYTSGDGVIVALLTRTTTVTMGMPIDMSIGTGVAVFGNLSSGTFSDAGVVTLNGTNLSKQANNSYVIIPSVTNPTGIDLSGSNINWSVGTPSFTYNAGKGGTGRGMPTASGITGSYTSINTASDFTLSVDGSVSNSDSVYFQINGASKSLLKRMGPNTKSVTFTSAELKTLGTIASGSISICPWNHELKTLGGKSIHVINELALSKVVEIK